MYFKIKNKYKAYGFISIIQFVIMLIIGAQADKVRKYDRGLIISEISAEIAVREIYHFLAKKDS